MKKAFFTLLLMTAVALAFVSGASNKVIQAVSDKIDEGDYYVTQFNFLLGPNQQQRDVSSTRGTSFGPTTFSSSRSGGSRSSENKYRPFNTSTPSWISRETPSEQDIDRAIASYEAALKLLPSGTWKPNRSTTLPPEGGIQARLEDAKRLKQQWMAEKSQREQRAVAQQTQQQQYQAEWTQKQEAQKAEQARQQEAQKAEQAKLQAEAALTTPNGPEDFDVAQNAQGGITIIGYKGTRKHVIIPDTLYGLKVTSIGSVAFFRKGLISVVIPNTVTTLENGDTSLVNPDLYGAFSRNNLVKVTLGNSLRTIGNFAFYGNPLTELTIPDSVTVIDFAAFYNCDIDRITLGRGLRKIGAFAFRNNNLKSLSIPNGVTSIDRGAFASNPLTTLSIPESLAVYSAERGIEPGSSFAGIPDAFDGNFLTRVTLPANFDRRNSSGLDDSLINYYTSQGSRAGTFVKNGPVWVKQ
jgi:hypothetical protein